MDSSIVLALGSFLAFLTLVGLASAAQTAFAYLNAARLRHLMQHGATRSQAVAEVVHRPGLFLSGMAVLYMVAVAGATVTLSALIGLLHLDLPVALLPILIAGALVLMAQVTARTIASERAEVVAGALYWPMELLGRLAFPLALPAQVVGRFVLRVFFRTSLADRASASEEDLRVLVDAVEETEALEEEERDMIASIFEMSDREVREIMVPRVDVVAVEASSTVSGTADVLVNSGHSRVPVYDGDLDSVVGLLHIRAVTEALKAGRDDETVANLVRPVHFVPETKKIDELLHEFQSLHIQMALVADEYGGTAGVVTIEDLLEEIVGEIRDEYDVEEDRIQIVAVGEAILDGRVSIHDLNEALPLELDDARYDTVGGLVYDHLGKVPVTGDVVELDRCTIRVEATAGRRVQRVRVIMHDAGVVNSDL